MDDLIRKYCLYLIDDERDEKLLEEIKEQAKDKFPEYQKKARSYVHKLKEFALKLLNTDRHYTSQLGLQTIAKYQTKIRYPLRNTDFTPPPAVPTVLFEAKKII